MVYIIYKNKKLKTLCENNKKAIKKYGSISARKLVLRLNQLNAAENLEIIVQKRIGRCHLLKGNYEGKYAMDLKHPYRLIFQPTIEEDSCTGEAELSQIEKVEIMEVTDYHD